MNSKLKRSLAVVLTAAVVCCPLASDDFSSGNIANHVTVSSSAYLSGSSMREFSVSSAENSYILYFSFKDKVAKTVTLTDC